MAVAGLQLMRRRLRAEMDKKEASPSQVLLHELLDLLAPEAGIHMEDQLRVCPL